MSGSCPLNFEKVDANLARFSSLFVLLSVLLYLYTDAVGILFFLAFDFGMRLFVKPSLAPINLLATFFKNLFGVEACYSDGGAKRLAAYFGFIFVLLLIATHYFGNYTMTLLIAGIFLSCSFLDVFFNFCIACKIYYIMRKIYPNFMNNL